MVYFRKLTKNLIILPIILSLLIALLLACSKKQLEVTEIKIGHIAPLTGDAAIWGNWESDGINLAVDEINSKGGIVGAKLKILHEDDKADPKVAVSALQKLINIDGVKIVIGATLSSPTLACAPIAEKNKVILLSPSAQSPKISQAGDTYSEYFRRMLMRVSTW